MSDSYQNKSILKNVSYLTLGRLLGDVFTFILFIVLARVYGQDGLGEYSFAVAFAGFLIVFVDYGLTNYSIKELSSSKAFDSEHYGGVLSIRLILSVFVCLLLLLILPHIPIEADKNIIFLICLSQILIIVTESLSAAMLAKQDAHLVGFVEFTYKLVSSVAVILPSIYGKSLFFSLSMLPISGVVYLLLVFLLATKKYGRPNVFVGLDYFARTLKEAFTYAVFIFLHQLSTRTDIIIIGVFLGASSVGIYNAAYRVIFLLMLLAYFCELALMPVASKLYQQSKDDLVLLYNKSFNIIMLVAIPLAAGVWLISEDLIALFFGAGFIESSTILGLLSCLILLAFVKSIIGVFLTSCDMQYKRTKGQWIAAIINLSGTILLIPLFGMKGAAIATIISEVILVLLNAYNLKVVVGPPKILKYGFMASLGSLIFCGVILSLGDINLFLTILLAAIIYFMVLLMFNEFRKNEFRMVVDYFNKS